VGVLFADRDDDGWPDIYVANESTASALFQNKKNGKFQDIAIEAGCALSADGKPQAGMGVSAADYDLDGNLDIVKTNFAGDTPSLYRNSGGASFEDTTFTAGLGAHTQFLGWGCGFFDMDNDGWADILFCNGHVYPEVEQLKTEAGYAQRKLLYQNLHNGHFADVSFQAGLGISEPSPSRGAAFGDVNNDGNVDIVVYNVGAPPSLFINQTQNANHRNRGCSRAAMRTSRLAASRPDRPCPNQHRSMPRTCAIEPKIMLVRWPNRSANHPVGTSSATSARSPAARIAATAAADMCRSCTHQSRYRPCIRPSTDTTWYGR